MRRPLPPHDARLWALVAATVRPGPGKQHPVPPETAAAAPARPGSASPAGVPAPVAPTLKGGRNTLRRPVPPAPPAPIEPRRKRRISLAREPIGATLDLHGFDQDRARSAIHGFIQRAHADGVRAVLIITGKGALGDGVLRRRTPDWLAEPVVRHLVAGLSQAERHHGGEGALYVALKRGVPHAGR